MAYRAARGRSERVLVGPEKNIIKNVFIIIIEKGQDFSIFFPLVIPLYL